MLDEDLSGLPRCTVDRVGIVGKGLTGVCCELGSCTAKDKGDHGRVFVFGVQTSSVKAEFLAMLLESLHDPQDILDDVSTPCVCKPHDC